MTVLLDVEIAGDGSMPVTAGGSPGQEVIPQTAAGVNSSFVALGAVADLFGFRMGVDATEATDASNRLANGNANVGQANLGQSMTFTLDDPVTRLDLIGIADLAAAAQTNGCMGEIGTAADALAEMATRFFPIPVSRITVSCSKGYATTAVPTQAQLHIQGWYF
jgi:hypothetical protein